MADNIRKKSNVLVNFFKGLGLVLLWTSMLLLISWILIIVPSPRDWEIPIFFIMLLINVMMLYVLILTLRIFEEDDRGKTNEGGAKYKILYGFLGLIFGILTSILVIIGHGLILFLQTLSVVTNRLVFGPYPIMLLIVAISTLLIYVFAGVREGTRYVGQKE